MQCVNDVQCAMSHVSHINYLKHLEFNASWNPREHCKGVPEFTDLDLYLTSSMWPTALNGLGWTEDSVSKTLGTNPQACVDTHVIKV